MNRSLAVALFGLIAAVGCSSGPDPGPKPAGVTADPYDVYLKNNPDPSLVISREDAQTRALLGCGQQWAPGTIDAALRDAYGHLCKN